MELEVTRLHSESPEAGQQQLHKYHRSRRHHIFFCSPRSYTSITECKEHSIPAAIQASLSSPQLSFSPYSQAVQHWTYRHSQVRCLAPDTERQAVEHYHQVVHWISPGRRPYCCAALVARVFVFLIFSSKSLWNVATRSSGGPCSMMSRTLVVRPTEVTVASDLGRDSMT